MAISCDYSDMESRRPCGMICRPAGVLSSILVNYKQTYDVGDLQCSRESACNTSRRLVTTVTSKIEFSHVGELQDTNQDFFS